MFRRRLSVALLSAALAAFHASPVLAQNEDALIEEGVTLRERGQDAQALERFESAYELTHSARALAQIALAEQALTQWVDAHDHLTEALRMGGSWIDTRRAPLEQALATIRTHIGTLEVRTNVEGAEVTIDGRSVSATDPIAIAAGSFVLEVRAPGHSPFRRELSIAAGQVMREEVELAPTEDEEATPPAQPQRGVSISPIGLAVAGVGGAMLIAGAITGGLALERDGTLAMLCPNNLCVEEARPVLEERRALAISADVLIFGGLAVAATGVVLAFLMPSTGASESARADRPRLYASCSPTGCGAVVRGVLP